MKTAVSLPDEVFEAAEGVRERLGLNRSDLYRQAIEAFIATHSEDVVTLSWQKVLDEEGHEDATMVTELARETFERNPW